MYKKTRHVQSSRIFFQLYMYILNQAYMFKK